MEGPGVTLAERVESLAVHNAYLLRKLVLLRLFFQAEDGIRDVAVTGVQTCALPISRSSDAWRAALSSWVRPLRSRSRRSASSIRERTDVLRAGGVANCDGSRFRYRLRTTRSEERRVGKECRARWSSDE